MDRLGVFPTVTVACCTLSISVVVRWPTKVLMIDEEAEAQQDQEWTKVMVTAAGAIQTAPLDRASSCQHSLARFGAEAAVGESARQDKSLLQ